MLTAEQVEEEWRAVVGFECLYEISNIGRLRSPAKRVKCAYGATRIYPGRIIRLSFTTTGYLKAALGSNQNFKTISIHRLVAIAFIENPESKSYVNHIDGCKTNNSVGNLEWCTKSEDAQHAQDAGLNRARFSKLQKAAAAINGKASRLISFEDAEKVRAIRSASGASAREIYRSTGFPKSAIDSVLRGRYVEP